MSAVQNSRHQSARMISSAVHLPVMISDDAQVSRVNYKFKLMQVRGSDHGYALPARSDIIIVASLARGTALT